jgi:hypothetical protein
MVGSTPILHGWLHICCWLNHHVLMLKHVCYCWNKDKSPHNISIVYIYIICWLYLWSLLWWLYPYYPYDNLYVWSSKTPSISLLILKSQLLLVAWPPGSATKAEDFRGGPGRLQHQWPRQRTGAISSGNSLVMVRYWVILDFFGWYVGWFFGKSSWI